MNRKSKSSRLSRKTAVSRDPGSRSRDIRQYYSSQVPGSVPGSRGPNSTDHVAVVDDPNFISLDSTPNIPSSLRGHTAADSRTNAHAANSRTNLPARSTTTDSVLFSAENTIFMSTDEEEDDILPVIVDSSDDENNSESLIGGNLVSRDPGRLLIAERALSQASTVSNRPAPMPTTSRPAPMSHAHTSPAPTSSASVSPAPLFNDSDSDIEPNTERGETSEGFRVNSYNSSNSSPVEATHGSGPLIGRTRTATRTSGGRRAHSVITIIDESGSGAGTSGAEMTRGAASTLMSMGDETQGDGTSTQTPNVHTGGGPEPIGSSENVGRLPEGILSRASTIDEIRNYVSDDEHNVSVITRGDSSVHSSTSTVDMRAGESVLLSSHLDVATVNDSTVPSSTVDVAVRDRVVNSSTIVTVAAAVAEMLGSEDETQAPVVAGEDGQVENEQAEDGQVENGQVEEVVETTAADLDQSVADFQPRKFVNASHVAAKLAAEKKEKESESKGSDSDNGDEGCTICFEMWTTSGKHRVVSLKCGHLFGQSCIVKWLKGQGQKCPQCNVAAKVGDIRVIYARSLKAVDTTESERLRQDLEKEREQRRKLEMEAAEVRLAHRLVSDKCKQQQEMIQTYQQQITSLRQGGATSLLAVDENKNLDPTTRITTKSYLLEKNILISEVCGCRVGTCSVGLGLTVISQPSPNQLFPGHGVKKLSCMDWRTSQYVSIHSKPIRDLCVHPHQPNHLLSASMDKTLKLTSLQSNTVILTLTTPAPVWSCTFGESSHQTVAGLGNGQTLVYDTRRADQPLHQLSTGSRSPVVAVKFVEQNLQAAFRPGGLLVGQLDRCSFHQVRQDNDPRVHYLPLEGSLCSLSFQARTRHLLATFRPSSQYRTVRHQLCELMTSDISRDPTTLDVVCTSNSIHTFNGGHSMGQLSRSTLFEHPEQKGKLLVCAGDETSLSAKIWDGSEGRPLQKIKAQSAILDTEAFTFNNEAFLTLVTDKSLSIYKYL